MFKSYAHVKSIPHYFEHKFTVQYRISDTDFEEASSLIMTENIEIRPSLCATLSVINTYKQRNLNIAANLALFFRWYCEAPKRWDITSLTAHTKNYIPEIFEYEKDIQKYLLLL